MGSQTDTAVADRVRRRRAARLCRQRDRHDDDVRLRSRLRDAGTSVEVLFAGQPPAGRSTRSGSGSTTKPACASASFRQASERSSRGTSRVRATSRRLCARSAGRRRRAGPRRARVHGDPPPPLGLAFERHALRRLLPRDAAMDHRCQPQGARAARSARCQRCSSARRSSSRTPSSARAPTSSTGCGARVGSSRDADVRDSARLARGATGRTAPATRRAREPSSGSRSSGGSRSAKGWGRSSAALNELEPELLDRVDVEFLGRPTPPWPVERVTELSRSRRERAPQPHVRDDARPARGARPPARRPGTLAVMPSFEENSPNVIYECLENGIPFIASNAAGSASSSRPTIAAAFCSSRPPRASPQRSAARADDRRRAAPAHPGFRRRRVAAALGGRVRAAGASRRRPQAPRSEPSGRNGCCCRTRRRARAGARRDARTGAAGLGRRRRHLWALRRRQSTSSRASRARSGCSRTATARSRSCAPCWVGCDRRLGPCWRSARGRRSSRFRSRWRRARRLRRPGHHPTRRSRHGVLRGSAPAYLRSLLAELVTRTAAEPRPTAARARGVQARARAPRTDGGDDAAADHGRRKRDPRRSRHRWARDRGFAAGDRARPARARRRAARRARPRRQRVPSGSECTASERARSPLEIASACGRRSSAPAGTSTRLCEATHPMSSSRTTGVRSPAALAVPPARGSLAETAFVIYCHGPGALCAEAARKVPDTVARFGEEVAQRACIELADAVVSPSEWLLDWMRGNRWPSRTRRKSPPTWWRPSSLRVVPPEHRPEPAAPDVLWPTP